MAPNRRLLLGGNFLNDGTFTLNGEPKEFAFCAHGPPLADDDDDNQREEMLDFFFFLPSQLCVCVWIQMDPVGRVGMILHLYFPSVRMEKETQRGRNRYMMDRFLVRADSHVPVVDYHLARLLPPLPFRSFVYTTETGEYKIGTRLRLYLSSVCGPASY